MTNLYNNIAEIEIIRTHEKKAKKEGIKNRIKDLMNQGIDKETAKVMANIEWEYQI